MTRTIAIWICGLLGSGIAGYIIAGSLNQGAFSINNGHFGFFAGVLLFACIRLWIKEPKNNSN